MDTETGQQRVRVARNLNKRQLSIRVNNKVVGYTNFIKLADVKFVVQEGGRQRCLREGRKNLHAFAEGRIADRKEHPPWDFTLCSVSYNPYKAGTFVNAVTGEPVLSADYVVIMHDGWMLAYNPRGEA